MIWLFWHECKPWHFFILCMWKCQLRRGRLCRWGMGWVAALFKLLRLRDGSLPFRPHLCAWICHTLGHIMVTLKARLNFLLYSDSCDPGGWKLVLHYRVVLFQMVLPHWKNKTSCIANILDTIKRRPLNSPPFLSSNEPNSTSLTQLLPEIAHLCMSSIPPLACTAVGTYTH